MAVVDTSVWIDVFADHTGRKRARLLALVGDDEIRLTRFHQLELLQGARDEREWTTLASYLETQDYLEPGAATWTDAARWYFDLRRAGRSVRGTIDCLIAQLTLEAGELLLHRDRDFSTLATLRPLREQWVAW